MNGKTKTETNPSIASNAIHHLNDNIEPFIIFLEANNYKI